MKEVTQRNGIDFEEIYALDVKMPSIGVILGLTVILDLEVEQMDVKTIFPHGDLEEEIYIENPGGFKVKGKEKYVCKLKKLGR